MKKMTKRKRMFKFATRTRALFLFKFATRTRALFLITSQLVRVIRQVFRIRRKSINKPLVKIISRCHDLALVGHGEIITIIIITKIIIPTITTITTKTTKTISKTIIRMHLSNNNNKHQSLMPGCLKGNSIERNKKKRRDKASNIGGRNNLNKWSSIIMNRKMN